MADGVIKFRGVQNTPCKETVIEWRIDNIFSFCEKHSYFYCESPTFSYGGNSWDFRLWPNSEDNLVKVTFWCECNPNPAVDYTIGLKKYDGSVEQVINGTTMSWYDNYSMRNVLIQRTELLTENNVYAPGNTLTITCTLKTRVKKSNTTQSTSTEQSKAESLELKTKISNPVQPALTVTDKTESLKLRTSPENSIKSPFAEAHTVVNSKVDANVLKNITAVKEFKEVSQKKERFIDASTQTEEELHVNKLLQALKEMLLSSKHTDFILNVKGSEFRVHKVVLEAHSPVFAAMLEHDTKEKATGIVDIADFEPLTVTNFLDFLYTGKVENLNSKNVLHLYEFADKYQVTELSDLCLKFIINNISIENFCDILTLSLRHHLRDLTQVATRFFLQNSKEIAITPQWMTFLAENPVAGNELFLKIINRKQ